MTFFRTWQNIRDKKNETRQDPGTCCTSTPLRPFARARQALGRAAGILERPSRGNRHTNEQNEQEKPFRHKKIAHYFLFLEFHQKVEKGSEKVEREGKERERGWSQYH